MVILVLIIIAIVEIYIVYRLDRMEKDIAEELREIGWGIDSLSGEVSASASEAPEESHYG